MPALFDGTLPGLGLVEEIPFFARQTRLTFACCGVTDPLSLTDYETMKEGSLCALGGFTPYPVMSALRLFPDDFAAAKEAAE